MAPSKKIRRLARPKTGRKTFSYTVALTFEQIEFLNTFPNASEYLRELLDSVMQARYDIEAKFPTLKLKHEIDTLQARADKLARIRYKYYVEHGEEIWEKVDNENGVVYVFEGSKMVGEKPATVRQTENAQYHFRVWKSLGEEQAQIQAKIEDLKEKIIHSEN